MKQRILLFTPPFTQLNTPYPATAYLKGFLNTQGVTSLQVDLGIEVINRFFSKEGFTQLFELTAPYQYISDVHPAGFYADRNIESYLGESLTEAKATLKEWDALLGFEKD